MRYFIDLAYDGTHYHGWQIQNNVVTVQRVLNEALSTILRTEISTIGSGRTDTGVHAMMQVVHFDYANEIVVGQLAAKLNSLLPQDIAVRTIKPVKEGVSARFEAVSRAYIYKIHQYKNPFLQGQSYQFHQAIDLDQMNACCELIKTWKDFEAMSKVKTEVNNFNCEIFDAYWKKHNGEIHFHVSANRFLRGMVRALVGTMLDVGQGRMTVEAFQAVLESRDRKKAGRSVPAHGLYLRDIIYPKDIYL
ncbi:tRNA pseudouridine(38-40) synthase TruA [Reichenbachiella carrageenanivorans]|uniref:tRNA pseudouridine synthase A n=1 Tax=Reichenbachiella carrageenanivorans TaxID=2979869 RepID=A0ABY6D3D7_9BACT|nr:tRNA pseudouridine(38-40) synthase TruA [Reichenbachiella carrageenanivorans]UXX80671.1 tRNA pseudouridine(38-40) synthase TruA [Reichenbachiella carrageenanivorans]